ncbi:DUF397 domain-containing protein [Streptomyces sp. NPDC005989]|uniref:DUF397 domain-containing protein n=1 Tax=Streptomyces sp. NPDC005989 TaxID=3156727 RepID=UPI0033E595DB
MTKPESPVLPDELTAAPCRKSSFSGDQGACVEVAPLEDGRIAVRNSNHPEAGVVFFTRTEMVPGSEGLRQGSSTASALSGNGQPSAPEVRSDPKGSGREEYGFETVGVGCSMRTARGKASR